MTCHNPQFGKRKDPAKPMNIHQARDIVESMSVEQRAVVADSMNQERREKEKRGEIWTAIDGQYAMIRGVKKVLYTDD